MWYRSIWFEGFWMETFCYWASCDRCFYPPNQFLRNICCFRTYVIWSFICVLSGSKTLIDTRSFPFLRVYCFGKSLFNINFMSTQRAAHILQIFYFYGRKKSFEQFVVWISRTMNYPEQLSWRENFMPIGQRKNSVSVSDKVLKCINSVPGFQDKYFQPWSYL